MGTKNCPGDFDCYANAEPDEPMFVLLARDPGAAALVREWVDWRQVRKEAETGDVGFGYDSKALEALRCADAMDLWRAANTGPKEQR